MIKKIMAATLLWLTFAATPSLHAQKHDHTLGDLWPEVEKNYAGVKAKNAAIEAAHLNEKVVKDAQLPQIKAQVQSTYGTYEGNAGSFFAQPGIFNVSGATQTSESHDMAAGNYGSATIEWEVFSFGKLRSASLAADAMSRKTVSEKEAYLLHLKKILSERYISLLYHAAKLSWSEKNVQRLNDIRRVTAGLSAAGLKPAADSLLASSSYLSARGEQDKWIGLREAATIKLSELFEDGAPVDFKSSSIRFIQPEDNYVFTNDSILPLHPALEALREEEHFYCLSGKAQKQSAMPSLRLLGGYAYRGTGINPDGTASGAWTDGFHNTTQNMLAGIGIVWNISGLHTNRQKGASLLKKSEETRWLYDRYEKAMRADLSAFHAEIKQQFAQLRRTATAVRQAQDAYQMFLARYKSGLISLTELLQIQALLEQAEDNHIEASRSYWLTLASEAELTTDFNFLFNHL